MLASHSEGKIHHRLCSVFSAVHVTNSSANFPHLNKKENGLTKEFMEGYSNCKKKMPVFLPTVANSNPMLWLSYQGGFRASSHCWYLK
jgi:hypothetical protein